MRIIPIIVLLAANVWGQVIDSFDDGNFTTDPPWGGDTGTWQIVTDSDVAAGATNSNTLRLNVASGSGTKYLSTQRTADWGTAQSWSFWLGIRARAADDEDQSIVWLWANEATLTSGTVDGYRVRFGDSIDDNNLFLQRVDNGTAINIITSSGTVPAGLKDIGFMVRVTRTSGSVWTLYTSTLPTTSGTGAIATDIPSKANTPNNQGSNTGSDYTTFSNGYFGFMAIHRVDANSHVGAEFDQLYFDTSSDASLPVELTSFTARQERGVVILEWVTESEIENIGFIVERRETTDESGSSRGSWAEIASYITHPELQGQGSVTYRTEYSYTDNTVEESRTYDYILADVSYEGVKEYHSKSILGVTVTETIPDNFTLYPAYPNPFNPSTTIEFRLSEAVQVKLTVYNLQGQAVKTLVDGWQEQSSYSVKWSGKDDNGVKLSSGIYFILMRAKETTTSQKIVLSR